MLTSILNQYPTITLQQMSSVKLMNRTDTKFVTSVALMHQLLELAHEHYLVQQTDGNRISPYSTIYYDTPDAAMYVAHHNGHLNRQKVRIRSYVDSNLHFLEVKTKDNHRRTHKKRIMMLGSQVGEWDRLVAQAEGDVAEFFNERLHVCDHRKLVATLDNRFRRVTLVNSSRTERLTIDTELTFENRITGAKTRLPGIAVIELKRDGLLYSPVLEMMRSLRIMPHGFSKYCIGMALTNPDLKQNRFKERLRSIARIAQS